MTGLVLKGVGSFYTVLADDGTRHVCKARGKFRKERLSPIPGDRVEFTPGDPEGYLLSILKRRNQLIRPSVANIDRVMIVLSASVPKPDLLLCDKLLIACEINDITPVIVINKCDEQADTAAIAGQYKATGYELIYTSAHEKTGLDELFTAMKGHICCFAGQSAVGKSSLLNALIPGLTLETGGLSRKTDRGRHTTRHAELIPLEDGTVLVDTPGFSLVNVAEIEPEELCRFYPDMRPYLTGCKFPGCLHITEPECRVREALDLKKLDKQRYQRYVQFIDELDERKKHRYD